MNPEELAKWLADFKAGHELPDLAEAFDPYLAEQRAELAAAYVGDNLPPRYSDALPCTAEVRQWVADVVRAAISESHKRGQQVATIHEGPSLLVMGATGTGKTFEAYGAMRLTSALGLHSRWVVISAADLYAKLRPRHGVDSEAEFERVAKAPMLAVDDLGAAKTSEWVEEVNFRLVNTRYEAVRPTLFTSNVPPAQLAAVLGDRVASRLTEMTKRVVITGKDRRRAA